MRFPVELLEENEQHNDEEQLLLLQSSELMCEEQLLPSDQEEGEEESLCCTHIEQQEEEPQTNISQISLKAKNDQENEEQNQEIKCVTEPADQFEVRPTPPHQKEIFTSSTCLLSSHSLTSSSSPLSTSIHRIEPESLLTSQIHENLRNVKETQKEELQELTSNWVSCPQLMEMLHCSTNCHEVVIVRNAHLPVQYYPFGVNVCEDLDNDTDSDVEEIVITDDNKNEWDQETFTMLVTSERILLFICAKLLEHISVNTTVSLANSELYDHIEEKMHLSVRMYVETLVRNYHTRQGKSKLWQRAHNINNLLVCCVPEFTGNHNNTVNSESDTIASNKCLVMIKLVADLFSELQIPCLLLDVTNFDDTNDIFDKITQEVRCKNNNSIY